MTALYVLLGVAALVGLVILVGHALETPDTPENTTIEQVYDDDQGRWWFMDSNKVEHGPFASAREVDEYFNHHFRNRESRREEYND